MLNMILSSLASDAPTIYFTFTHVFHMNRISIDTYSSYTVYRHELTQDEASLSSLSLSGGRVTSIDGTFVPFS